MSEFTLVKKIVNICIQNITDVNYRIGDIVIAKKDSDTTLLIDVTSENFKYPEDLENIKEKILSNTKFDEIILKKMYGKSLRGTPVYNSLMDKGYSLESKF